MKKLIISYFISIILLISHNYLFAQETIDKGVARLSEQIAKEMTDYQKTTIAVVEFSDLQGNITNFGRFLAEELITHLYKTGKFKVIERQLLNKVINEQKLNLKGLVDPTSAKELGKILGVDAIVSGTITDLNQSLRINGRLISTETGEIFAVASTDIFKDESVKRLMKIGSAAPGVNHSTSGSEQTTLTDENVVTAEGFSFKPVSCKREGGKLVLTIQFMNIGDEQRKINISISGEHNSRFLGGDWYFSKYNGKTYIYDNLGNQYSVSIKIGNFSSEDYHITTLFVPNVPVNVHFISKEINVNASKMTITIDIQEFKELVTLRNIPIE